MRDALSHKVAVVIDERDQRDLADREAEKEEEYGQPTITHVKVSRRVSDSIFAISCRDDATN
jgi:hypothetical protein